MNLFLIFSVKPNFLYMDLWKRVLIKTTPKKNEKEKEKKEKRRERRTGSYKRVEETKTRSFEFLYRLIKLRHVQRIGKTGH